MALNPNRPSFRFLAESGRILSYVRILLEKVVHANDGPVVLDFDAEQVRHYGVELVFVYKILVGDPGRTLLEFYELMFEQGLVHRTIDRFVNILFLGV